jgi:hypothetical protein
MAMDLAGVDAAGDVFEHFGVNLVQFYLALAARLASSDRFSGKINPFFDAG